MSFTPMGMECRKCDAPVMLVKQGKKPPHLKCRCSTGIQIPAEWRVSK